MAAAAAFVLVLLLILTLLLLTQELASLPICSSIRTCVGSKLVNCCGEIILLLSYTGDGSCSTCARVTLAGASSLVVEEPKQDVLKTWTACSTVTLSVCKLNCSR